MLAYSRYMHSIFGGNFIDYIYCLVNKNTNFKVKLLHPNAKVPTKADSGCAGYDLYSNETFNLLPGERTLVSSGISTEFDRHFYLRVAPRSGMSVKGIDVGAGVIDSSYRGEIKVLLINNSKETFVVNPGDRIAQLILERCSNAKIIVTDSLGFTSRGQNGFGSTGV